MSRKKRQRSRRLMVLDTNVLMHDPSCLLRFHEHDVFIPMIVLEELDNNKRGHSEVARNARQDCSTTDDYRDDQVLDDLSLLATGQFTQPEGFWERNSKNLSSWQKDGNTYYKITGPDVEKWYPNQLIHDGKDEGLEAIVRQLDKREATIEVCVNYRSSHHNVWGINARNREQNFALNLLMDPAVDFVSLLGNAGTGKTLLTLAAGLAQVLDERRYQEIIMSRATVPMGEDIGFLPGTEEEKMVPWMGALMDNLEVLASNDGGSWGRAATNDLLRNRIKIHSMNFMRGRTFLNKYVIIDEAQNLTSTQMQALITRAGPGPKMVVLGKVSQIDTPYLTETTSGRTYVGERFKLWQHSGHITLRSGERSRLADYASEALCVPPLARAALSITISRPRGDHGLP